jgi:PAS domain S-box-containing protein
VTPRQVERQLATARRRLQRLRARLGRAELAGDPRLRTALDELTESLDSLSPAFAEISSANEELAEAHLAASEQARHYQELFRLAPDAYVVTDDHAVIRELNAAAEKQLGRARHFLIGKPLVSLVAAADVNRFLSCLAALCERRAPLRDQPMRLGADPGWDAAISATAGLDPEDGEIHWILRDVTEQRRGERALRASDARSRAALELAFDGMLETDAEGRIVSANAALRRMFGYGPDDLEGRTMDVIGLSRDALAKIAEGSVRESVGVRRDGSRFPIQISARGTRGEEESPIVSTTVRDLSVQRGLESRLRAATAATAMAEERERQRLAADLHDDIGQMLSLAGIKLGMLSSASGPDARRLREEVAELVTRTHRRTESLMFQLSPPILRDMGLTAAVEWLAEDLGKSYGLRVHVEHDGEPALDEATRITAFRSLRELLINAARHAHTKDVAVKLAREGDHLGTSVEDRGVGFDWSSHTPGFGLASVRERVEALGGHFEVDSEVGGGTRVHFVLALAREPGGRGSDRGSSQVLRPRGVSSVVNPSRIAYFVRSATLWTSSLRMMLRRWVSAVLGDTPIRSAIWIEVNPSASSWSTSRSRGPRTS